MYQYHNHMLPKAFDEFFKEISSVYLNTILDQHVNRHIIFIEQGQTLVNLIFDSHQLLSGMNLMKSKLKERLLASYKRVRVSIWYWFQCVCFFFFSFIFAVPRSFNIHLSTIYYYCYILFYINFFVNFIANRPLCIINKSSYSARLAFQLF